MFYAANMEGAMDAGGDRLSVDGHTFWRARRPGGPLEELTTVTGIELDGNGCRWEVRSPGAASGRQIVSRSREVMRYMHSVTDEMRRATRRAEAHTPVPKPVSKPRQLPPLAPVPCPACHGGAWHDCELCDGSGVVTQRQADAWERDHAE